MAENYVVNYNIKVNSQGVNQALNNFKGFTESLQAIQKTIEGFEKSFNSSMERINGMFANPKKLDMDTKDLNAKLDTVIRKLTTIKELSGSVNIANGAGATNKNKNTATGATNKNTATGAAKKADNSLAPIIAAQEKTNKVLEGIQKDQKANDKTAPKGKDNNGNGSSPNNKPSKKGGANARPAKSSPSYIPTKSAKGGDLAYKALGPSMLDSGGIGILDMIKGMGVAYGISSFGSMVGEAFKSIAEYDNIIATTKNILKSHDTAPQFDQRFESMERNIRNVGIKTKFTAPEVADASKFLAMAGLNIDDINNSIGVVADMALVADTELGETADAVTNIMTGYEVPSSKLRHAVDAMTNTTTMSNTTLMEIGEASRYVAPLFSAANVPFEEGIAAIGALGNAGIKASQAGTTMRTLMANIINPTKKQLAVWKKLGIKRTDKNGNIRDLIDIFTDLKKAGLTLKEDFKMFNRTASPGAAALVARIGAWKEIADENYLSDGITAELAETKKNTIQGLFAQLTSMFTENSMNAFTAFDQRIRDVLRNMVDWLKTNDAQSLFNHIGESVFGVVEALGTFTKIITNLFRRFEPFITSWLKFQLVLSAILIPLRIVRSLINFGKFALATARGIGAMAVQFSRLANSLFYIKKLAFDKSSIGRMIMTGSPVFRLNKERQAARGEWLTKQRANVDGYLAQRAEEVRRRGEVWASKSGFAKTAPHVKEFQQRYDNLVKRSTGYNGIMPGVHSQEVYDRRDRMAASRKARFEANVRQYGGGVGSMVGAGLGAYYGSYLGEEGSGMSVAGSLLGMMAGGAAGAYVGSTVTPWLATTAIPFLLTNPAGWGIALAGVLGAAAVSFINYQNAVDEANEANNAFLASTSSINGIDMSEHASAADQYLSMIYNRQLSVNQILGEHIRLMQEQLGILDNVENRAGGTKTLGETHGKELENASTPFESFWSMFSSAPMEAATSPIMIPGTNTEDTEMSVQRLNNGMSDYWSFNGRTFTDTGVGYKQIAAARFLYGLARSMAPGSDLARVRESFNKRLLAATTPKGFNAILEDLSSQYISEDKIDESSKKWEIADLKDKTQSQYMHSYDYVTAYNSHLSNLFDIDKPGNNANAQVLRDYLDILKEAEKGKVSEELLARFLLHSGIPIFDEERFEKFGSTEFMEKMGFDPKTGQWKDGTLVKVFNTSTNEWEDRMVSAKEAQQSFNQFHQMIVDKVAELSPHVAKYFDYLMNHMTWGLGEGGVPNSPDNNHSRYIDSLGYLNAGNSTTVRIGKDLWRSFEVNGKKTWSRSLAEKPISDEEFQKMYNAANNIGGTNGKNTGTGTGTGTGGPRASDYQSHYKSSAAPKQVIVRIGNLMNVDKIDLSNPNNSAVIASLKSELAQALVDVVHDFDETWHG